MKTADAHNKDLTGTDYIDGRDYYVRSSNYGPYEIRTYRKDTDCFVNGWMSGNAGYVAEAILIPTAEELKAQKKDDCPNEPMCPCCQKRLGIGESAQKVTP